MGDIAVFRTDVWPSNCREQLGLHQEDLKAEFWSPAPLTTKSRLFRFSFHQAVRMIWACKPCLNAIPAFFYFEISSLYLEENTEDGLQFFFVLFLIHHKPCYTQLRKNFLKQNLT